VNTKSRLLTRIAALSLFAALALTACSTGPGNTPRQKVMENWRNVGPGGAGAMFAATVSPHDPDHFMMRCDMTGSYVTADGGASWHTFNLRTAVQDFEFDPQVEGRVYAGNSGLYVTEDGGQRWRLVYPQPGDVTREVMLGDEAGHRFETTSGAPGGRVEKVRVHPQDSNRLYIGIAGRGSERQVKLLSSSDGGETWSELIRVPGRTVKGIFPGMRYGKPGQVALLTGQTMHWVDESSGQAMPVELPAANLREVDGGSGPDGGFLYILSQFSDGDGEETDKLEGGVFRSTDAGASWTRLNKDLPGEDGAWPDKEKIPAQLISISACQSQPQVVYISVRSWPALADDGMLETHAGIMKSTDAGENWHWVYRANSEKVLSENSTEYWRDWSYGPGGWSPWSVGVCPTNPDVCYGAGTRNLRTTDGGAHWQQIVSDNLPDGSSATRGTEGTTTYGMHFDPFDKEHVFISYTDLGAYHSFNGGKSWFHSIKGIPGQWRNTLYWMEFDPQVKDRIWGAWSNVHDLPRSKMFRSGNLVNGRKQGGVALSLDGGRGWQPLQGRGLDADAVCTHIVLDPDSPVEGRTLYVCAFGSGVFKSTDGGQSWQKANSGLGQNLNAWRITRLPDGTLFLQVSRGRQADGRTVLDGVLYRSDDGAASWQPVALPAGVNAPNDLVFDPADQQVLYLSCWPQPLEGEERGGGLLRSVDGGSTWKRVFRQDAHVYASALDKAGTLFIATFDNAAFRSDDAGESWQRLEGYNFKWGHRPTPDPHNPGMIYITTFGGSVFYGPARGVPGAFEDIEGWDDSWRWGVL
jgi:photosystem II stability/assembly factor-like uncharacterized protein